MSFPIESKDQKELKEYYGDPGECPLTRLKLPYPMVLSWDSTKTINSFYCHEKVADSLYRILARTLEAYGYDKIKELRLNVWGGCFNVRKKRGSKDSWSTHSYAISIDLDPNNNRLSWRSDKACFAKPEYDKFWEIVESEGWKSLGRSKNFDWMHIQATS
jgi:hypothetical protein